ncbi:tRNA(Ser) Um(44) 2'-O-methyltransferase [Aspergillus brasiliensis]|uniref:tRNA (uracil-O(2)-)-methyltransferase n=1 Tax=Aspergillus brasiliensis TaxID=319629 RepID=A0A9W5YK16_9EURO|nr:tRNA(Ser) Um(44) 2'-O-methyltransferase [Aspergillus brasiliensis]GKZ43875.1 tRNA(Ser) Um(44) 2'-O-methyltransferase [Aspergillus brasiliensis]
MTGNKRKNPRDLTRLSGKPLAETLEPSSVLASSTEEWVTSQDLAEYGLPFKPEVIQDMTLFLLANPNMSSSHLYRADILFDSWGLLRTPQQKEQSFAQDGNSNLEATEVQVEPITAREITGFTLTRTVVRRLIPRNPNLDRVMDQTCHFYERIHETTDSSEESINRYLAVYIPHITSKEDMPFYHPLLRSLAFLYDYNTNTNTSNTSEPPSSPGPGTMSIHFLLFPNEPIQNRLERTLQALLSIQIRLARGTRLTGKPEGGSGGSQNPAKDNVIPQHLVQNTYTRLKAKYAAELCQKWVESTEPSKHVFEDLSITAFLIELWRSMYGAVPADEQTSTSSSTTFPGFVDVACGNGVLVYVLLMEGYEGWGFDARRRKTWSIFPESVQSRLTEEIYIPKPFSETSPSLLQELTIKSHTGSFPKDTFIISNHADELTVWTPLMATLLCPESPSPFIAIPCCSHSLSGARFRYPPPKAGKKKKEKGFDVADEIGEECNPSSGDLKSLRKEKQDAQTTEAGFLKSMYGSLTAKTMSVAEEIGYEVERTLLRIPSTRNMAVIGGRRRTTQVWKERGSGSATGGDGEEALERVMDAVRRECSREGGVESAAKIWIERAKGLNKGSGMGKQGGH